MQKKLGQGVVQVITANAFNLFISLLSGFLMPKYLSIPSYAQYKTFFLYISYVGVCHLGYIDGVYLKYGGKEMSSINKREFSDIQVSLVFFQIGVSVLGCLIGVACSDIFLFLAALCILPVNLQMFYKLIFQATGEFLLYRRIINTQALLVFVFNMILLLLFRIDNAAVFCGGYLFVNVVVCIFYMFRMRNTYTYVRVDNNYMLENVRRYISDGYILMIGNFLAIWIVSIDRWFVKFMCSEADFAYYSFAVSILKFLNAFMGAFSITLYNDFCSNNEPDYVKKIRKTIIFMGALAISCAFIFRIIIELFLNQYIASEPVIILLTAAQLLVIIINAIFLNLYKAFKQQKKYLRIIVEVSCIAVILNILFAELFGRAIKSFACATVVTMVIWLIRCQWDLKKYRLGPNEAIYMVVVISAFILFGRMSVFLGLILYLLLVVVATVVLYGGETVIECAKMLIPLWKDKKHNMDE